MARMLAPSSSPGAGPEAVVAHTATSEMPCQWAVFRAETAVAVAAENLAMGAGVGQAHTAP
ncbi:hypothetical protein [Chelativorans sp.]|uniref:hypothetical protein n=1 Tax=Chelativorans sp. TaxID=2203393 RepID=UPI00281244AC|nr:hypothetical protein [Chelativorans sp.]